MENTQNTLATTNYQQYLQTLVADKKYVQIQYRTELQEILTTTALINAYQPHENGDYLVLSNGEEIRVGRLVRVGDRPAPGAEDYFFCDC